MKFISSFLLLISMLQGQQIRSGLWTTDQFVLRYRTMMEPARPAGKEVHIGGGGADDSTTNHRILKDADQKKFFGYDLQVTVIDAGRFQLNFKPLSVTAVHRKFFELDGWDEILLPSVPASMLVNDGETVALDLMANPTTGERIVEYISVSAPSSTSASRRDLQVGDIQMSLGSPQLQINGTHWAWNHGDAHGVARGAVLWMYVPDRGRFLISFAPHAELGFKQAGEGKGNQIKFSWNGETFELKSVERVLPADGAWNVYVYQDRSYQPGYPPVLYGASDRAENLLRR
jgi:hypothetical protein